MTDEAAEAQQRDLIFSREGAVALLRFNRPKKINCMNGEVYRLLEEAVNTIAADDALRCLVVSGEGGNFSSGGDFKWYRQQRLEAIERGEVWQYDYPAHRALAALEKPVIAAVDGNCIAAGLSFALFFCDIRLASTRAKFSFPAARQGLGGTGNKLAYGMPFHEYMGLGHVLYLLMTGEELSAETALRMGLVNEVMPPERLMPRAIELAQRMAEGSPALLAAYKRLCRNAHGVAGGAFQALQLATVGSLPTNDYFERSARFLTGPGGQPGT